MVAKWTDGFSYAYLKELFICSLLRITATNVEDGERSQGLGNGELADVDGKGTGRNLPQVDVPQSIQSNKLLNTLRLQAQGLLEDLDNTTSTVTDKQGNANQPPPIFLSLASPLDDGGS